ncbi:N-acetylglucosamine-6-phosphate deacetylase [Dermabacteraceae bacterium TAE3-ERU27]|nr:N-acetylglucosamine-6-phosphate deacetylase [Dermabacteraceae bacterium TAE3-ERU27]
MSVTVHLGTAVLPDRVLPGAAIAVRDGNIVYAGPASSLPAYEDAQERVHEGLILPGLVDIHCHGGGGVSFPDSTDSDSALVAVNEHLRHGTTSLVVSLVTASPETLRERIAMLAPLVADETLAGVHMEGPYISPHRCGAQNPAHVQLPDADFVDALCSEFPGVVKTMTIAPELPGADETIAALAKHGAIASLGHTDSAAAEMEAGIAHTCRVLQGSPAGVSVPTATHLFNGMRPIHHRDAGPAFACLDAAAQGRMIVELVGDGVHTSPDTIRYVFSVARPGHVMLITDAMAAAGMPDGAYTLGSLDVEVKNGVATLAGGNAIAGGTAHLLDVVRCAVTIAGVELASAVRAASETPARVLGLANRVGSLRAGLRADLVFTDDSLHVKEVLRAGAPV